MTPDMVKAPKTAVSATCVSALLITAHATKNPQNKRLPKTARRRSFQLGRLGLVEFDVGVELGLNRVDFGRDDTLPPF
jgi:hypothetical protein